MCPRSAALNAVGASTAEICLASSTTNFAFAIPCASSSESATGVGKSRAPAITRVGVDMSPNWARKSQSRRTAQQPAKPLSGVSIKVSRNRPTVSGSCALKRSEKKRVMDVSAMDAVPPAFTASIRDCQPSAVPSRADVLHKIKLASRCGAWRANHWPKVPPKDKPHRWTDCNSKASRTDNASAARSLIVYSPGGASERPCPRAS